MLRVLLLTLALAPLSGNAAALRVFVSVPPQQTFVEKIGGDHVEVAAMVRPGFNPATYEPSPRQISALADTSLYVRIGVPFEKVWMERIRSANPEMRMLDARDGIDLRAHPGEPDHDPHVWTSPPLVRVMAANIRDALIELDPANHQDYARNHDAFAAELDELDREIRALLQGVTHRTFMVFHPAWGYFADAYGLTEIAIEHEGKEPGARTLTALIERARRENIKVVFAQPQFDQKLAAEVARAIGGRVVLIDPLSPDYVDSLRGAAREMAGALRP